MTQKKIEIALANHDCVFDSGIFDSVEEAIEFAKGRGGVYIVSMCAGDDDIGISLFYDDNNETFGYYNGHSWEMVDLKWIKRNI